MNRDNRLGLLETIAEGTGWATGHEFFRTLVRCLAESLDTPCAFVCEFAGDHRKAHTLAYWLDGKFLDEFDYALAGTPCERALDGRIVPYPRNICELFPDDGDLRKIAAESYLAIPLKTLPGEVVGHLAVIDRKERDWHEADFGILRIFAARTTAEFARRHYELELEATRSRLEKEIAIREEVETALRESERAYKEMYEDAPIVYWSTGTDGLIRTANRRAGELFGFTRDELIGRPVMSLVADSPHGRPVASDMFRRFLDGQEIFDEEVEFVSSGGETIWGSVSIKPFRNALGQIEATRSAVTNISAHKRAEQALEHRLSLENLIARVSSRFVSAAMDDLDPGIDTCLGDIGAAFRIERTSVWRFADERIAVRTHRWQAGSPVDGDTGNQSIAGELDRNAYPALFDAILANRTLSVSRLDELGKEHDGLRNRLHQDGVACLAVVPIASASTIVGMLTLEGLQHERDWPDEDVTLLRLVAEIIAAAMARRDAETALEEARLVAETANSAKTRFLANMSHELRTPLNGILGFAQVLDRDPSLDPGQRDAIHRIEHCGKHLLGLINDVLDLTRIEAGRIEIEPADTDLARLLEEVSDIARLRCAEAGLGFSSDRGPSLPGIVRLDARRLRQILINLLGNAVKYTPAGNVKLRVTGQPTADRSWHLKFEVHDTGVGIAESDLDRIFEPFRQLRPESMASEGTGLGLAITRELVSAMNGTLQVASTLGEGSVFTLELTVGEIAAGARDDAARRRRICGYDGERRIIVAADDKLDNRRLLTALLAPLGFVVHEAVDGSDALALVERVNPDLVFMDLVMPVMDGFEATRRLRSGPKRATPVIAVSASAFDETRRQSRGAGCDDFIPKPLHVDAVLRILERHLGLTWQYDDETDGDNHPTTAPADTELPDDLLERMYHLARQGDIAGLNDCLVAVEQLGPAHTNFVAEIRSLARNFDMRRIRERLRRFVEPIA